MAAVRHRASISVRAAAPEEGAIVAGLWRELWDAHEAWGGYAGTREQRVYDQLAVRLSEDARVRAGQPVLGRHVHLVASNDANPSAGAVGQVEGWFERHGADEATPYTCEVRSLIVSERARTRGVGHALLDELARVARQLGRGGPVVLAAEVLEPNPAHSFYASNGYTPVSWTARVATAGATEPGPHEPYHARVASPADALPIALLDPALAARRRAQGDIRFDRPRAVDATFVGALAAHLARPLASDQSELVALDAGGMVRATASLTVMSLDPPFLPARRGLLGRFAMDPALDPRPLVTCLVRLGRRLAHSRGAATLELTDLDPPGHPLNEGALRVGAVPWSRIVERFA
jgi:GNAT superfamily N-acetyltransferase